MKLNVDKLTFDGFVGYLRSALHYLYDPVQLRRSPLLPLFHLYSEFDRAAALQRLLIEAIGALKPTQDEPAQSNAWLVYDTLSLLYVSQFTRDTVAVQLGVSDRQLRREQRVALEALAQHLWNHLATQSSEAVSQPEEITNHANLKLDKVLNEDLVWLNNQSLDQCIPLGETLETVQKIAQLLAQQWQSEIQLQVEDGTASLTETNQAMRSILLTILSVVIPHAKHGHVTLSLAQSEQYINLRIVSENPDRGQVRLTDRENTILETGRRLASLCGVMLSIPQAKTGLEVSLRFPAPEQIPVLVIDDNTDWLEMLKRYTTGSHYRLIGTREPENARSLAEKIQPAVIFVDIMMPNIDGWQIISELRNGPTTSHIPIVICTILPLEGVALSLGVNAFLQKPVTQDQFLNTIEHLINAAGEYPPPENR